MRPGVKGRQKPSSEAEQSYAADVALAARRSELLDAASEAESQYREAQARRAPDAELRRRALDLDSALTAAMHAAYAAQRAAIGPRGAAKNWSICDCRRSGVKPTIESCCDATDLSTNAVPTTRPKASKATTD